MLLQNRLNRFPTAATHMFIMFGSDSIVEAMFISWGLLRTLPRSIPPGPAIPGGNIPPSPPAGPTPDFTWTLQLTLS